MTAPQQHQQIVITQSTEEDKALIHKLQLDIKKKLQENRQLEADLHKMSNMMTTSFSQKEVVKNLKKEYLRMKDLLDQRDKKIMDLMDTEKVEREKREQLIHDLQSISDARNGNDEEIAKI